MNNFDQYKPRLEWFLHNPYGIHGLGHLARVLVWVNQIARAMIAANQPVDMEVCYWAAGLHDVRRISDGADYPHGQRSGLWIKDNIRDLPVAGLDYARLEKLIYCCRWHVTKDSEIPEMTPELICLKDADGLDRVRLGDLNVRFLRTNTARLLVKPAKALFVNSQSGAFGDPWDMVRDTALQTGLWK